MSCCCMHHLLIVHGCRTLPAAVNAAPAVLVFTQGTFLPSFAASSAMLQHRQHRSTCKLCQHPAPDMGPEARRLTLPPPPCSASPQGSVRFSWLASSNASSVKALTDAGIKTADSIVIGDRESVNDVDADARVLASILQVRRCCWA